MQRILSPSLSFWSQILTFPKCLKRKETNSLGGNFFVTLLLKKKFRFLFFCVVFLLYFPSCCIGIVKYVVHSENQGKSRVTRSSFADLLVLPMLGLDACLVWDAVGPSGLRFREHFLYLEVVTMELSCAVPFSVSLLPVAGGPVKWPLAKIREQRWHRRVKEILVLALSLGSLCWPQGWPGVPHTARTATFLP